jgi:uncharacterized protein (DUF58 family)
VRIRRVSPRIGVYAALAGALLLVAALLGRMEPLALAAPLAAAVLLGLATAREPRFELEREVTGQRVFEGETTEVWVTIRALTDLPLVELACPLPDGAILTEGANQALVSLRKGESRRVSYSYRMRSRCRYELGPVRVRAHLASGLAGWEAEAGGWTRCVVYPKPAALRARLVPRKTRVNAGSYPSRVAGEGIDFLDLRPFVAGDQTRRINWRATARRDELVVNQFSAERNADVVIAVDVLSDGGEVGRSVLDLCARGAAALSRSFLREKNRVGFLELGHYVQWLTPSPSRRQWFRILDRLAGLQVRERFLTFEISSVPARILPPGAFVIGWSSLVNPVWSREIIELKRRGYDVVVVSPWAPDAVRDFVPATPESAMALRIWELEQRTTVAELERIGVRCIPWHPEEPLDLVVRLLDRAGRRSRR